MLEAEGSGAAPVFVVAYNHFAVEFLLLLLECVFHLLPLQSSIPGERVISSSELQAHMVRNFRWGCSAGARQSSANSRAAALAPYIARARCRPAAPMGSFLHTLLCQELHPWTHTALNTAALFELL